MKKQARIDRNLLPGNRRGTSGPPGISNEKVKATSDHEPSKLDLPNERDEKLGMTGGVQSARIQQGALDLKRGVQDISRAPEADVAYKRSKR